MLPDSKEPARIDVGAGRNGVLRVDQFPAATWHSGEGSVEQHRQMVRMQDVDSPSDAPQPGLSRKQASRRQRRSDAFSEEMDRDAVRRKGALAALLTRLRDGEIDILVGTQMIAKGHDFPRVTLVGVISADTQMLLPDFRSSERTFQLKLKRVVFGRRQKDCSTALS